MSRLKTMLGVLALLLVSVSPAHASTLSFATTIDGLDWTRLNIYDPDAGELYSLCSESGLCNGVTSAGTDLTGWNWAGEAEAFNLMNNILGSSLPGTYVGDTTSWFDIFEVTGRETFYEWSAGIYVDWDAVVSENPDSLEIFRALGGVYAMRCSYLAPIEDCNPEVFSGIAKDKPDNYFAETGTGGYLLWRPSPVPVPAAFWLFGTALIGLVGVSRRKKAA